MIFEIEAPNGRKFEIEGDSAPNEQELEEIYASISPSSKEVKEVVSENIQTPTREWDSLDDEIQNFRNDYKDLSPELQSQVRQRYSQMKENQQAREIETQEKIAEQRAEHPFGAFGAEALNALTFGLSDVAGKAIYGEDWVEERKGIKEENPISSTIGAIAGSIGPRAVLRSALKPTGLYGADKFKNILGRNLLESAVIDTPTSLINQATGISDKQSLEQDFTDYGINVALGTGIESLFGFGGKIYNKYSKNARTMRALGGKDNFKRANDIASKVAPEEQKSVFTKEIFSNMSEADQKNFAKKFIAEENFRKEVAPLLDDEFLKNRDFILNEIKKSTIDEAKSLDANLYKNLRKDLQNIDLTEEGFKKQLGKDNIEVANLRLKSINDAQNNINKANPNIVEDQKLNLKYFGDKFKESAKSHENLLNSVDSNSYKSLNSPEARFEFYKNNQSVIDEAAKMRKIGIEKTGDIDPTTGKNVISLNPEKLLNSDEGKILLNQIKTDQLLSGVADNTSLASDLSDLKAVINDSTSLNNISSAKQQQTAGLKKGINSILEYFSPLQAAANNVEREMDNLVNIKNTFTNAFDIKGNVNSPESLRTMLFKQIKNPETGVLEEVLDLNNVAAARSGLKAIDQVYAILGDNASRGQLRKFLQTSGLEDLLKLDKADKIFTKDLIKETNLQKTFLNLIKSSTKGDNTNNLFNIAKSIVAGSTHAPLATFNNIAQVIKNSYASPAVRKTVSDIIKDYNPGKANTILKSLDPLTQKELSKFINMTLSDIKVIPQQIYMEER